MTIIDKKLEFLHESYKGDIEDMAIWYESLFFTMAGYPDGIEKFAQNEPEKAAQLYARARNYALGKIKQLKEKSNRAAIGIIYDANSRGWFRLIDPSFDDIKAFVASHIETAEEGSSESSDWLFLGETAIPLLEQKGYEAEEVLALPYMPAKARVAVPRLRHLMKCPKCGREHKHKGTKCRLNHDLDIDDAAKEEISSILSMIADIDTNVTAIKEEIKTQAAKDFAPVNQGSFETPNNDSYEGARVEINDGSTLMLIIAPSETATRSLEIKLGAEVEWTDWTEAMLIARLGKYKIK
jgi:hypothetical protein